VSPQFLIIIVLLFGVLWMVLIRPQKRRQTQQRDMLENLSPGDEILTAGGFYATVRSVDGDDVEVELAPGTKARLAKRAVAAVIPPEQHEEDDDKGEDEEAQVAKSAGSGISYGFDGKDESTPERRS
jgi:preprotein translocase subunit YajC